MSARKQVIVSGGFDDLRARQLRFLEEASKLGDVTVLLWPDETLQATTGKAPKFPPAERLYFLNSVRYVKRVLPTPPPPSTSALSCVAEIAAQVWVEEETDFHESHRRFCHEHGLAHCVLPGSRIAGFPEPPPIPSAPGRKKVIATGCYDWFHSGHVRFT